MKPLFATHTCYLYPFLAVTCSLQFLELGPSKEKKGLTHPKEKHNKKRLREENSDLNKDEIRKKVSAEWAALDSEGRARYVQEHEEDKKGYAMEMEERNLSEKRYVPVTGFKRTLQGPMSKGVRDKRLWLVWDCI
jgi:hypothetical protein